MPKLPAAVTLAAALLIGPAVAQTPPVPSGPTTGGSFIAQQSPTSMRLSRILGLGVIGLDHTRIGDIDEILIDHGGRVDTVVVGVGGILGIGAKDVAIPFDQVLWNTGDVSRVTTPSASLKPGDAPPSGAAPAGGPERMPGASVGNEVLGSTSEGRAGAVNPGTGPVTTGATDPATVTVVGGGRLEHAEVHLAKDDVRSAPSFRYIGDADR